LILLGYNPDTKKEKKMRPLIYGILYGALGGFLHTTFSSFFTEGMATTICLASLLGGMLEILGQNDLQIIKNQMGIETRILEK